MKAQDQVRASTTRKAIIVLAIVVTAISAGVYFWKFYFVQELLLFLCVAAIVAFFVANLMMLGVLLRVAAQTILHLARKANPALAAHAEVHAEPQPGSARFAENLPQELT
jgi:hypothetical protein